MRRTALTLLTSAAAAVAVFATAAPALADHGALTVTGLTVNDRLVTFSAADPSKILSETKISGLGKHDDVAAIDFRPATGGLYAIVTSKKEGARLFLVDPKTGAATRVGTATYEVAGEISIDFNPTVDRLRVVGSEGTNLRVNPNDGALAATDLPLAYAATDKAAGVTPAVGGAAYTNNDNDAATPTTLFDIDAAVETLVVQAPPNDGVLTTVGRLGQPTVDQATGFDIYTRTKTGTNWAFVSLTDKGATTFYEIDLATGLPITATTPVPGSGKEIAGKQVTDIALAPGQPGFM